MVYEATPAETRPTGWTEAQEDALRAKLDEADYTRWPLLDPFPEVVQADAPFPVEALPKPLDQYVRALADSLQVPHVRSGRTYMIDIPALYRRLEEKTALCASTDQSDAQRA